MTAPTIRPASELRPSQRLLDLLPGIYRQRDAVVASPPLQLAESPPLANLVAVIGAALDELHDAVGVHWDDHFVERASAAALPLLAELFGVQLLSTDVSAQRALVGRIVGWRRRKGTLVTLEEILTETSTWDTEVDEGFRSVLATFDLAHAAPWRGRTALTWDPIGMADPLTRRSPGDRRPRDDQRRGHGPMLAPLPGEELDETLRRLGRVDAGRHAASPRTLDLRGWVRPDAVLIRSARLVPVELEQLAWTELVPTVHGQRRGLVDPAGRDTPLVWLHPVLPPDLMGGLTERHEPDLMPVTPRMAATLLTPTALAEDADAAERAGAFQLDVDGVPLVGPPRPAFRGGPLEAQPVGEGGRVAFAEPGRPSPGDTWRLTAIAAQPDVADPTATDAILITAELGATGPTSIAVAPGAGLQRAGRAVELLVERVAGEPRQRSAAGAWSALAISPALGPALSNAVVVPVGAERWVVRIERHLASGTNRLVRHVLGTPGWTEIRTLPDPVDTVDGVALIEDGGELYAVVDVATSIGVWLISDLAGAATVMRVDVAGARVPPPRESPSLAVHDGRLYVFGGDLAGAAAGDMWSMALGGGPWSPHALRRREERMGATLLSTAAGLVLIGGDPVAGQTTPSVRLWDVAASRSWRELPSLPFSAGAPGFVVARATAAGLEALVWADRTRPVRFTLATGAAAWVAGALEPDGPNPPAPGEAVFDGDAVLVIGPAPLPSSDVVITQGDHGVLAVLPRLTLAVGQSVRLRVAADGSTFRRDPATAAETAIPRPLDSRFGGLFGDAALIAPASDGRYAQPGRLVRRPWTLRQRSLGPWDDLIATASADAGTVMLDPRLGRVVLPPSAPPGRVTLSCRIGRGGSYGPGLVTPGRNLPPPWCEPDLEEPLPPDLIGAGRRERDPHAYVAPHRAGQRTRGPDGGDRAITADLDAALALVPSGELPRLAVLGSARVPFARVTSGVTRGLSLVAADSGTTPVIERDDERDLSLLVQAAAEDEPEIWLAGLWLLGALDLAIERGQVDLRWCQLAGPGRRALWAPGAGHQDPSARRSMPRAELEIRLFGCHVGMVELPPWARLVAAGCTFDAGDRDLAAIEAPGATVRLRHCTINGRTHAGQLEASSCAFAGEVRVDRDDLGFVRHSLVARGGRTPRLYESRVHTVSMVSLAPTSPGYLVLAENNGRTALAVGEGAAIPGAFGERGDHERELDTRTRDFLPIGMDPVHVDRTTFDLHRLDRR